MTPQELQARYREQHAALQALLAREGLSAEDLTQAETLTAECDDLQKQINESEQRLAALAARAQAHSDWAAQSRQPMVFAAGNGGGVPAAGEAPGFVPPNVNPAAFRPGGMPSLPALPATAAQKRTRHIKAVSGRPEDSNLEAYRLGMWMLSLLNPQHPLVQKANTYCLQHGLSRNWWDGDSNVSLANIESVNVSGGMLVPIELANTIIRLVEEYGVFRKHAEVVPMRSDLKSTPRRTAGLTIYPGTEATAPSDSTMGWDHVTLIAKKWIGTAIWSTELAEDAVIEMADILAREFAFSFAKKEDDCGFNGDGGSTYQGIIGVTQALLALSGTIANIAGLQVATGTGYGTNYASVVLKDFSGVKGRLPQYAFQMGGEVAWYMSRGFFNGVAEAAALAAGGVAAQEVYRTQDANGRPFFLGYPVVFSQVLPTNSAVSQVCALFGNLRLAAQFGDRRVLTMATSEHAQFTADALVMRGTERFDENIHDVGNASGTASARVAGPVVGLITAAS